MRQRIERFLGSPRYASLTVFFAFFLAGIGIGTLYPAGWIVPLIIAMMGMVGAFFGRYKIVPLLLCVMMAALGLGMARVDVTYETQRSETLYQHNNTPATVKLTGDILDEPERNMSTMRVYLTADTLDGVPVTGRALITLPRYPDIPYGTHLTVKGVLQTPRSFAGNFDYAAYLARYDVQSILTKASVVAQTDGVGNPIFSTLFIARASMVRHIAGLFQEPEGSIVLGLLTGDRGTIPKDIVSALNITSLTHLVAIDGYKMNILIAIMIAIARTLPGARLKVFLVVAAIICYTLLVGSGASAVRAAIMGGVGYLALTAGSPTRRSITILGTAAAMALWSPLALMRDVAFQLSFLAVIGIALLGRPFEKIFHWVTPRYALREAVALTFAAEIAILPLMALYFGQVSVISPIAHILTVPIIPPVIALSLVALAVSYVSMALGVVVALPAGYILRYFVYVATGLAGIPYAAVSLPVWATTILCLGASVWVIAYTRKKAS